MLDSVRLVTSSVTASLLLVACIGCGSATTDNPAEGDAQPEALKVNGMTAVEVMEKMVAVYREAETYYDDAKYGEHFVTASDGVQQQSKPITVSVVFERPSKFRIIRDEPTENATVACDGERLQGGVTSLAPQILDVPAPASADINTVAPDPLLREAVFPVPVADLFPQLALLMTPEGTTAWPLARRDELVMLPAKDLRPHTASPRRCYRVKVSTPEGPRICWIEQGSFLLFRIEIPANELGARLYPGNDLISFAYHFDFYEASIGEKLPIELFRLTIDEETSEIVTEFREPEPDAEETTAEGDSESDDKE